tara:strand:+ start:81 stop:1034 length:954 start_codon:yes stop_codon:yes gene_type:complete
MTIKRFGQAVRLEVFGPGGELVFDSDGLRVDFDVVNIPGYSRATFKVWNMDNEMVKQIQHGDRFCKLTTTLHDDTPTVLVEGFQLSNAFEQTVVPDSITTLFTYSGVKGGFLNKQIKLTVKVPTLKNVIKQVVQETRFEGNVRYKNFPKEALDYVPPRNVLSRSGSVEGLLDVLARPYRFKYFTEGKDLVLMYQPTSENINQCDLDTVEAVVIDSNNLGTAPRIGPGQLEITCNLDASIVPTVIVDISNIVSATPLASDNTLQVVKNYMKDAIAGYTRYQVITVQHKGSNFTKQWDTVLTGTAPTKGKDSPIRGWNM